CAGRTAVVIDVLRATTTIIQAISAGANAVIPCVEIDGAVETSKRLGPTTLLAGERGGVKVAGFDLGNSPAEYTSDVVAGRAIVLTTSNGTRAIAAARSAAHLLIGALVNRAAVAALAVLLANDVAIVCAGSEDQVGADDELTGGAIAAEIARLVPEVEFDPAAACAVERWRAIVGAKPSATVNSETLIAALTDSRGGATLTALGCQSDIEWCARLDTFALVPRQDRATGWIR
ncbi:MAG TPA: 2-phosphosulfolactate phosphatase, partial [Pirellulaceae bacterium]|nr:2-phosphosulfolactate phosphatase [Pirellulaceae bacterium]